MFTRISVSFAHSSLFRMGFGKLIEYKYGPVIHAEDFDSREDYFDRVEKCFMDMFTELYQTN